MEKVFILGIDGAFPEYIFGEWLEELPNLKKLMGEGVHARLNSTIPPLSATAWTSIYTGKPPADTGIFEYVYRKNFSYNDIHVITSKNLKERSIWEIASQYGVKSAVCYLLLTWPIKPFNGWMICDSLLASLRDSSESVYPKELAKELEDSLGEVPPLDLPGFRNLTKEEAIQGLYDLTEKHVSLMKYLLKNKDWRLFFGLIALSDRMNHSFWRYMDRDHRKYEPNSKFQNALKDYYKFVDNKLGEMLNLLDEDTKIIVLSDHGITRMHSRINLTDWLVKEGYLVLKETLKEKKEFKLEMVDWSKTQVFAIGAYEGQIFVNLKGREPEGIVEEADYDSLISSLERKLKDIKGDDRSSLDTKIFKKKDYFKGKCENLAPDIIVYFDNLHYGCNTTLIGNETLWSPNTAKGSDDACHSRQGIFVMNNGKTKGNLGEISYLDVAPTVLNLLGIKIPKDMNGKIIR
jgi:predicted AlkP superfamily phosphohydrolase/phosphomutase